MKEAICCIFDLVESTESTESATADTADSLRSLKGSGDAGWVEAWGSMLRHLPGQAWRVVEAADLGPSNPEPERKSLDDARDFPEPILVRGHWPSKCESRFKGDIFQRLCGESDFPDQTTTTSSHYEGQSDKKILCSTTQCIPASGPTIPPNPTAIMASEVIYPPTPPHLSTPPFSNHLQPTGSRAKTSQISRIQRRNHNRRRER